MLSPHLMQRCSLPLLPPFLHPPLQNLSLNAVCFGLFFFLFFFFHGAAGWTADTCSTALLLETHVHVCTLTSPFLCRAMDCECTTVAKTVGPFHKVAPKRPVASIKRRHVTMRDRTLPQFEGKRFSRLFQCSVPFRPLSCAPARLVLPNFVSPLFIFFFKLKL